MPPFAKTLKNPVEGGVNGVQQNIAGDEPVVREGGRQEALDDVLGARPHAQDKRQDKDRHRDGEDVQNQLNNLA